MLYMNSNQFISTAHGQNFITTYAESNMSNLSVSGFYLRTGEGTASGSGQFSTVLKSQVFRFCSSRAPPSSARDGIDG